jgi:hypothetical protein
MPALAASRLAARRPSCSCTACWWWRVMDRQRPRHAHAPSTTCVHVYGLHYRGRVTSNQHTQSVRTRTRTHRRARAVCDRVARVLQDAQHARHGRAQQRVNLSGLRPKHSLQRGQRVGQDALDRGPVGAVCMSVCVCTRVHRCHVCEGLHGRM